MKKILTLLVISISTFFISSCCLGNEEDEIIETSKTTLSSSSNSISSTSASTSSSSSSTTSSDTSTDSSTSTTSSTSSSTSSTGYTNSSGQAIPDNYSGGISGTKCEATGDGMLTSTINYLDTAIISKVQVGIIIEHDYAQDLDIYVKHADNCVELSTDNGDTTTNNYGDPSNPSWDGAVIFDDEASTSITSVAGTNIDPGLYKPEESLSAFNGLNSYGPWILYIFDDLYLNTGTLTWWAIRVY